MIQNKFLIYPNKVEVEKDKNEFRADAIVFISGDAEHPNDKSIYVDNVYYDCNKTPDADEIYDLIKDKISSDFAVKNKIKEATLSESGTIKLSDLGPDPKPASDDDKYGVRLLNGQAYVYIPNTAPEIPEVKDGVSIFKSSVFKRSDSVPETPDGGSFDNPYPNESYGWGDTVPADTDNKIVWISTRIFTSDGKYPLQDAWSTPANVSTSTDIEVLWNLYNGSFIPDKPSDNYIPKTDGSKSDEWITADKIDNNTVIWMAVRTVKNNKTSEWAISRVSGEKGEDGTSFKIKGVVSSLQDLYSNYSRTNEGLSFSFTVTTSTPEDEKKYSNHIFILVDYSLSNILGEAWIDLGSIKGADGKDGANGEPGKDGAPGDDGKSAFYHVKFTDNDKCLTDPSQVASNELYESPKAYMGYYVDYSTAPTIDSLNASDYTWGRCKGNDGFGYQYIYTLCASETNIPCPKYSGKEDSEDDKIGYGGGTQTVEIDGMQTQIVWTDNQESVSYEYPYCYRVWMRTDIQDTDGYWNGSEDNESSKYAVLVAKYGKDGENGEPGLDGKPGQDGKPGKDGVDGKDGKSVTIKASLTSINGLPTSGNTAGDGYLIDGNLWVYTGTSTEDDTHHNGFENVGQIKGEKGDKGDNGSPAYEYVVVKYTPSIITFDETINDTDTSKTYTVIANIYYKGSELDDYSDFESDADNCKLSITDTKNCNVSNDTDLSGIVLQMDIIKNSKTGWPDSGYFDFEVEYNNQTVKSRVPFVVNKIGTIYTTINNGVQSTIATKVKTYVDELGYVTTDEMNTAINTSANGIEAKITDVSTVANEAKTNAALAKATADGFETRVSTIEHQGSDVLSRLNTVESEITQTNSKIDASVKKNDLETVGIHLDGDNSTINLVADKTTIGGNTFITSDGKISAKCIESLTIDTDSITTRQQSSSGAYINIENGVLQMFVADWPFPALTIRADYNWSDDGSLTSVPRLAFYDRQGFVKCSIDIDGVHTYTGNGTWNTFSAFKIAKMYDLNSTSVDTTISSFVGLATWLSSVKDYCDTVWLIPTDGVTANAVIEGIPADGVTPMILTDDCQVRKTIGYCLADDSSHSNAVLTLYQYMAPRDSNGKITLDNNNNFTLEQATQIDGKVFIKQITTTDFSNGDVSQYYPEGLFINDSAMILDGYPTALLEDNGLISAISDKTVTSITLPAMKVATMVISDGEIQDVDSNDRSDTSSSRHPFLYSKASKTYTGDELKTLFNLD